MTEFSKNLEKYIYQSTMTENQLAKITGFNRSYIALIKNGQRIPADIEKVKKLIEALQLSPYEADGLWQDYLKARYGEEKYELQYQMISFLEKFVNLSGISIISQYKHEIPNVQCIHNRMDLEYMVKSIIENETLKENGKLKVIMQADFNLIYNLLPCICRSAKGLDIEHIVCLEGGMEYSEMTYNLQFFEKIVPIILSDKNIQYHVYYYYDKVTSHFSSSTLMPYAIITSDYVINISVDLNHAFVSNDKQVINLYSQLYEQRKRNCRQMIRKMEENENYYGLINGERTNVRGSEPIYSIGGQPCFGMFDVNDMILKYVDGEKTESVFGLQQMIEKNRQIVTNNKVSIVSYFSKRGLERLLTEGVVTEIPRAIYTTLDMDDRKNLIQMLIDAIKEGWYSAYLIDDTRIQYPEALVINSESMNKVNIYYLPEKSESRFTLKEQSLSKMIYDFLVDLEKSTYVLSKTETLSYLEKVIE